MMAAVFGIAFCGCDTGLYTDADDIACTIRVVNNSTYRLIVRLEDAGSVTIDPGTVSVMDVLYEDTSYTTKNYKALDISIYNTITNSIVRSGSIVVHEDANITITIYEDDNTIVYTQNSD
jgi:curli biogenesis system outer membrane secretion channel CsgG